MCGVLVSPKKVLKTKQNEETLLTVIVKIESEII